MLFSQTLRDKHHQMLAYHGLCRITEYLFRTCVDERDNSFVVDRDDGIGCCFGERPEFRLAFEKCLFGTFSLGDVASDTLNTNGNAFLVDRGAVYLKCDPPP